MLRKTRSLFAFVVVIYMSGSFLMAKEKTEVLIVPTLHNSHISNSNYSYRTLLEITESYKPEVIGVEIRKSDFRKNYDLYEKEMIMLTSYGILKDISVYPIDWFRENVAKKREEMLKKENIKEKEKIFNKKVSDSFIMQSFESKYGKYSELDNKNYNYSFWGGKDFNIYMDEMYKIMISTFGNSPITLYHKSRNEKMLNKIKSIIKRNRGKKIAFYVGADHKHHLDKHLKLNKGVDLKELGEYPPKKKIELPNEIDVFLKSGDIKDLKSYKKK